MSLKRYTIDGYGQIELNNVAFRRDGRIEAQCKLDATDFASVPAENGMLLAVDNVNRVVKFATDASLPIALHYSAEHIYNQFTPGLKNFSLDRGTFLPRLGYLSVGDKFTTNTVCYDTGVYADDEALDTALESIGSTPMYGGFTSEGAIQVTAVKPVSGPVLKVVQVTTMPDGQFGLKFQVISA